MLNDEPPGSTPVDVRHVDHVAWMVDDIDACLTWYVAAFGMTVVDRWQNSDLQMAWAHAEVAGFKLELVQRAGLLDRAEGGPGLHHIAFAVDDCASAVERLVEAGADVVFPPAYFDRHDIDWSFIRDPFGNTLEILSYRTPETSTRP